MKNKKCEEKGFSPSMEKAKSYSTVFERYNYAIPFYREPPESPLATSHLVKEYPFIMCMG